MAVALAVVLCVVFGAKIVMGSVSGASSPFTVVESQSMQHDSGRSDIGTIDTGDMVLVRSLDKHGKIITYVEGSQTGYSRFGEYGDVIIYERGGGQNPVIHRAILWLEYNNDELKTWNAPSLANWEYRSQWYCPSGFDYGHLSGTLTLYNVGEFGKKVSVNLSQIQPNSGYLTMGDSRDNTNFDQTMGIINSPINDGLIKSVAWKEIPWLGAVKLIMKDNAVALNACAPNSVPNLIFAMASFVISLILVSFLMDAIYIQIVKGKIRKDPF